MIKLFCDVLSFIFDFLEIIFFHMIKLFSDVLTFIFDFLEVIFILLEIAIPVIEWNVKLQFSLIPHLFPFILSSFLQSMFYCIFKHRVNAIKNAREVYEWKDPTSNF